MMKSFVRVSAIISLALVFSLPTGAETIDRVVASVGDDVITVYDVEKEGAVLFGQISRSSSPEELEERLYEAKKNVLEHLIEKVLLAREAKRAGIEVGDDELDSAIENIKKENGIDQDELLKALQAEGLTYERYREEVRGQMIRARLIDRKVRSDINISDEDIKSYYEANINKFVEDEEIRARHILFLVPKDADEKTVREVRVAALEVLRMAKEGEDFKDLAMKYSEGPSASSGGDLGFFKKKDMVKEFSDAAFSLEEGAISDLVRSPFGFHIIKVIEKRGGKSLPFAEAREKIRTTLYSEELERDIRKFVRELKEKEEVEIRI